MGKPKSKKPRSTKPQGKKESGKKEKLSTKDIILLITAAVNLINAVCGLIQKLFD